MSQAKIIPHDPTSFCTFLVQKFSEFYRLEFQVESHLGNNETLILIQWNDSHYSASQTGGLGFFLSKDKNSLNVKIFDHFQFGIILPRIWAQIYEYLSAPSRSPITNSFHHIASPSLQVAELIKNQYKMTIHSLEDRAEKVDYLAELIFSADQIIPIDSLPKIKNIHSLFYLRRIASNPSEELLNLLDFPEIARAIELEPEQHSLQFLRTTLAMHFQNENLALESFSKALKNLSSRMNDSSDSNILKDFPLEKLGDLWRHDSLTKSYSCYKEVNKIRAPHESLLSKLSLLAADLKDFKGEVRYLKSLIQLASDDLQSHYLRLSKNLIFEQKDLRSAQVYLDLLAQLKNLTVNSILCLSELYCEIAAPIQAANLMQEFLSPYVESKIFEGEIEKCGYFYNNVILAQLGRPDLKIILHELPPPPEPPTFQFSQAVDSASDLGKSYLAPQDLGEEVFAKTFTQHLKLLEYAQATQFINRTSRSEIEIGQIMLYFSLAIELLDMKNFEHAKIADYILQKLLDCGEQPYVVARMASRLFAEPASQELMQVYTPVLEQEKMPEILPDEQSSTDSELPLEEYVPSWEQTPQQTTDEIASETFQETPQETPKEEIASGALVESLSISPLKLNLVIPSVVSQGDLDSTVPEQSENPTEEPEAITDNVFKISLAPRVTSSPEMVVAADEVKQAEPVLQTPIFSFGPAINQDQEEKTSIVDLSMLAPQSAEGSPKVDKEVVVEQPAKIFNWRVELQNQAPSNLEDFKTQFLNNAFANSIEKSLAIQGLALQLKDIAILDFAEQKYWRTWSEWGAQFKNRNYKIIDSKIIESPIVQLLATLEPALAVFFGEKFGFDAMIGVTGLDPQVISRIARKITPQDPLYLNSPIKFIAKRIESAQLSLIDLPGIGKEIYFDLNQKNIYLDRKYILENPSSLFFHKINQILWQIRNRFYCGIRLQVQHELMPLLRKLMVLSQEKPALKMTKVFKHRSALDERLYQLAQMPDVQKHLNFIRTPNENMLLQALQEMELYCVQLDLIESLDLIGIVENYLNIDILKTGAFNVQRIFKAMPTLSTLIQTLTKIDVI